MNMKTSQRTDAPKRRAQATRPFAEDRRAHGGRSFLLTIELERGLCEGQPPVRPRSPMP